MTWTEIHKIDQLLTLEINSWNSFITDPMWQFFSDKLVWAPMYAAIIALLIWKLGWKRGLMILAAALLTFGFCDQVSNIVKHAVGRIRPLHDAEMAQSIRRMDVLLGGYGSCQPHLRRQALPRRRSCRHHHRFTGRLRLRPSISIYC